MGLSIPVILDGANIDASRYMTDAQLKGSRSRYLRKLRLWDPQVWRSWMRFFTLQSHYSLIVRSVSTPLKKRLRGTEAREQPAVAPDNTNPLFAPAFKAMVSTSRPVLLVFAETDRLLWEFEAKFMQRHRAAVEQNAAWYRFHVTRQANHIFSFADWQRDMLDQCCQWLNDHVVRPTTDAAATSSRAGATALEASSR